MVKQRQGSHDRYSPGSRWEITLVGGETISGEVFCTDPVANIIVLRETLCDMKIISLSNILESSQVDKHPVKDPLVDGSNSVHTQQALEERERRAIRIAEETLRHLNPKASEKGQAVFDLLLKACNEVGWNGEAIIVLGQIRVDPPYCLKDCKALQASSTGSLERVQKIVASAQSNN